MPEGISINEITTKCLLCATVMILGLFYYIPGPTFLELTAQVEGDVIQMLLLFTSRAVGKILGFIVGSLLFMVLLKSNQMCMVLFLSTFMLSVAAFIIPLIKTIELVIMVFFLIGFLTASTEIGVSAMCLNLFASETFILVIFSFYGLGSMVAPLLPDIHLAPGVNKTTVVLTNSTFIHTEVWKARYSSSLAYSYILVSSFFFVLCLAWMMKHCLTSVNEDLMVKIVKIAQEEVTALASITIIFTSILSFVSGWIDCAYIHVLPTYCMFMLQMTPQKSMGATLMFLGFHTLARTFLIFKDSREMIIIPGILLLLVATFFLYTLKMSIMLFYISNGMVGFGAGPLFPLLVNQLLQKTARSYRNIVPLFVMRCLAELGGPVILLLAFWKSTKYHRLFLLIVSLSYLFWLCCYYTLYASYKKMNEPSAVAVPEAVATSIRRYDTLHLKKSPPKEKNVVKKCVHVGKIPKGEEILAHMDPIKDKIEESHKGVQRTLQSLVYSSSQIKKDLTPSKVETIEGRRDDQT